MVKLKKYAKTALSVAILLLAIYFIFSAYKFITIIFERERAILVLLHLQKALRNKDLPDGEIKDIPLLFNEKVSVFIRGNKYVDRWGNPLDIRIIKTDGSLSFTVISRGDRRFPFYPSKAEWDPALVISRGDRRFPFYREDIGVSTKKDFKPYDEVNYFP